jgi:hypothetical protein
MKDFEEILMALTGLGIAAIKSNDPKTEALGAAILSIPMAAADSDEDFFRLCASIFETSKERIQRNEEIKKLLANED